MSLSSAGSLWGVGPSAAGARRPRAHVVERRCVAIRLLRDRLARLYCEAEVLRLNRLRSLSATLQGRTPGAEASIQKIMADEHGQHVMSLAKDLAGIDGVLDRIRSGGRRSRRHMRSGATEIKFPRGAASQYPDVDPIWHYGYLFSPALTLGGGTFAVQRNIVAEQVLGLPREPDVEHGMAWTETRTRKPARAT